MTALPIRWPAHLAAHMAALLLALCAPLAQGQPLTLQDDRGVTLTLAQPPQRIVSLLPSLTESVCALGGCARLVGVDRYSNWPASVRQLPQLGGGIDPNVEAVLAQRPDLVLLAKSSRAVARLEALGLPVLVLEPKSQADMQRVLGKIGQLLHGPAGLPQAEQLWREIEASVAQTAAQLPPAARQQRVYYEVSSGPFAAGASSFMGETLTRLGAQNIVPAALGPFPKLNPEFVVRANPDVIMIGARGAAGLAERPGWSGINAVRKGRICRFSAEQSDVLVRPGPRMGEAARLMADCLADVGTAKQP